MSDYRLTHKLLGSHFEFRFRDVCEFQKVAGEFLDNHKVLTGRDGMTNYIALLEHGHWAYFLLWFGNVYKYSQQGYENMNGVMKRGFHTKTQKGGARGGYIKHITYVGEGRSRVDVEIWMRRWPV